MHTKCVRNFTRGPLGSLDIGGRIVLKYILKSCKYLDWIHLAQHGV